MRRIRDVIVWSFKAIIFLITGASHSEALFLLSMKSVRADFNHILFEHR